MLGGRGEEEEGKMKGREETMTVLSSRTCWMLDGVSLYYLPLSLSPGFLLYLPFHALLASVGGFRELSDGFPARW